MNSSRYDSNCPNHSRNAAWPALPIGSRVSGTYHGVPYTGLIYSDRGHTINWTTRETGVDLETPIEVYGTLRDTILISACGACGGIGTDTTIKAASS